jgi:hypothetical protein
MGTWRNTQYSDGGEELYHHSSDPHEWTNIVGEPRHAEQLALFRNFIRADQADREPAPRLHKNFA